MKRKAAFLGSMLLMLIMMAVFQPADAAAGTVNSGSCGANVTYYLTSDGTLTISGSGVMMNYGEYSEDPNTTTSGAPWSRYRDTIKAAIIKKGVSSIGGNAFSSCTSMTSVTIPESVNYIGVGAFAGCIGLPTITLPQGLEGIAAFTFLDCASLTSITIPASVKYIGQDAFSGCSRLTDIYYGGTRAQWNAINIHSNGNDAVNRASLHYGGSTEPASFSDVKSSDWFAEPVQWAIDKGITKGMTATTFGPNVTCSTAHILTFLWRAEGCPEPKGGNTFSDVKTEDYYYKAALWAQEKGLVSGTSFNGNAPCTRAATVTYLWKLSGSPNGGNRTFSDVSASAYYAQAVSWAVSKGVTSGTGNGKFSPDMTCTRGQIVTFLYRWKTGKGIAAVAYTDEELCKMALAYYRAQKGYAPPLAAVDHNEGNKAVIRLYEISGNHLSTWEWYTVDRYTGKGTSMFSGNIDLTKV